MIVRWLYFSAAKGYRPAARAYRCTSTRRRARTSSINLAEGPTTKADYLWSYELGLKTQLFDRRLSIEGSVYHIDWSNIISAVHVPLCATHISKNLGDAKSDGFDLSLKALLSQSFTAGLYVGYTNAHYSSDSAIFGEDAGALRRGHLRHRAVECHGGTVVSGAPEGHCFRLLASRRSLQQPQ